MTWQPTDSELEQLEGGTTRAQLEQLRVEASELGRALIAELVGRPVTMALRLALVVALVVAGAWAVQRQQAQAEREAYCAGMGERWVEGRRLPDGSYMPAQCEGYGGQRA